MIIAGFFILLAIVVFVWLIGKKLVPVLIPTGTLRTIALGWAGGFLASWLDSVLWQFGPRLAGINLVAAGIGCLEERRPQLVALSPHDSCDWSLGAFRHAFGEAYQDLRVGETIEL